MAASIWHVFVSISFVGSAWKFGRIILISINALKLQDKNIRRKWIKKKRREKKMKIFIVKDMNKQKAQFKESKDYVKKEEILNNKEDNYLKRSCLYLRYSKMMPIYSTN